MYSMHDSDWHIKVISVMKVLAARAQLRTLISMGAADTALKWSLSYMCPFVSSDDSDRLVL